MSGVRVRPRRELRERRLRRHGCWDHVIAAPLWPKYGVNLGTLVRTCDAVGACLAVPRRPWIADALAKGDPRHTPSCIHWVREDPLDWLAAQRSSSRVVGVELAEGAVRLGDLPAARDRTVVVLGNEGSGLPPESLDLLHAVVEIPMVGAGHSLNVAVAGSLVLYKLAGLL